MEVCCYLKYVRAKHNRAEMPNSNRKSSTTLLLSNAEMITDHIECGFFTKTKQYLPFLTYISLNLHSIFYPQRIFIGAVLVKYHNIRPEIWISFTVFLIRAFPRS